LQARRSRKPWRNNPRRHIHVARLAGGLISVQALVQIVVAA
jgi:hypothetical protein